MPAAATTTPAAGLGVTHAFADCYREHWARVYRNALRFSAGDPGWAEDLAHDVFLKLLEQFPRLEAHHDLGGWLYRVTANLAVSRLRRERSWVGRLQQAWRVLQEESAPSPEVVVVSRERAAQALHALRALPPQQRVVICMKLLDGHSQRKIAETLDLSEGHVSKLVTKATSTLRAQGWEVSR
jgi:RNA polymerase sigma-70 factor (ECF subfamily)